MSSFIGTNGQRLYMKKVLFLIRFTTVLLLLFFQARSQTNQAVANGAPTAAVNFTGGAGCTYTWVNNTPGIGLAASGAGNIPSFAAINSGTSPVTATITATPVQTGYAYITSIGSGNVTVINTITNTVAAVIPVGSYPFGLCVSADGTHAYVANSQNNDISVISTITNTVTSTIPVGTNPLGLSLSPDGSLLYVANTGSGTVSVINTATNTLVATIPVGTGPFSTSVSPDGSRVYVTNQTDGTVSVIDAATNAVIATIPVGARPWEAAVSPDGSTVYVSNDGTNTISVISSATNTVVTTIIVGQYPAGLCLSPDGAFLYVANSGSNTMSVVNTATNSEITEFPESASPVSVSLSPDGSVLYVVNNVSGTVAVINTATEKAITTVPIGLTPYSIGSSFVSPGPGCTASPVTFTITVTANPPASVTITASSNNICAGTPVTFTATPTNGGNTPAYQWLVNGSDSGSGSSFTSNTLGNGDNIVCIMTADMPNAAPVSSDTLYMNVNPLPAVGFTPDTVYTTGSNGVQLAPSVTGMITQYQWSPAAGLTMANVEGPVADPPASAVYQLLVTTDKGCSATGDITVIAGRPLEMPGAFTPNGDGHNDVYRIPPGVQFTLEEFDIFGRWGNRVFISQDIDKGWDGTVNGAPADAGTYVYLVKGNDKQGKPVVLKGTVTLIR